MGWQDTDLSLIFTGVNDELLVLDLYRKMMHAPRRRPLNAVQSAFYLAWEATELVNGDGFEMLVEQHFDLEEYANAFAVVEMPQVCRVFEKLCTLVPGKMRQRNENNDFIEEATLYAYLREHFEDLKQLMLEFFDASAKVIDVLSDFVREHSEDFAQFATK